jgi:hypothetical protein
MKDAGEERRFGVDLKKLPPLFPTHGHSPIFWENLGRTVATFGFLVGMRHCQHSHANGMAIPGFRRPWESNYVKPERAKESSQS